MLTQLAKEFAICDNWFSSLPGPTWPNRFLRARRLSSGAGREPSPAGLSSPRRRSRATDFSNGNIFDLLDDYCIEWRIFEGDEFPVSFALNGMNLNALQGRFTDLDEFASEVNDASFGPKFCFIEPQIRGARLRRHRARRLHLRELHAPARRRHPR